MPKPKNQYKDGVVGTLAIVMFVIFFIAVCRGIK